MKSFQRGGLSCLLWGAFPLATAMPAMAEPVQWREAFQSSPRAGLDDEKFKDLVTRLKIPPQIAEKIKPQPVTGTLRYRVPVTLAGSKLRLRFSNEEGAAPLVISGVSAAMAGEGFDARKGSLRPVTFGGAAAIAIPAGAPYVSDPLSIPVAAGDEILVSYHVEGALMLDGNGGSLVQIAPGDQTMAPHMQDARVSTGRPEVTGVSVLARGKANVIVAFGDSITDGNRPSLTALRSWPDELARRLKAGHGTQAYGVVNAGIAGNRVLSNGMGLAGLTRLDRDALRLDGVTHLLVLEGTNDIAMSGNSAFGVNPVLRVEDLVAAYRQILTRAHARGVKVILGTILPFGGSATHSSPEREAMRQAVNHWIRTSGQADGIIDFDAALRDPADPVRLRADYDSGDHLHPDEAGSKAMGDAIALSLFR